MTGGAAVVRTLKTLGVKTVFDLPGLHTLPIYDALYDEPEITRIMVKHEGNASVMADVYGRLTGKPGVALVAAGPGATNSLSGLAQARVASSPVLHLSGTIPTDAPPSALHGLDDPDFLRKVFEPVTKSSTRVLRTGDISKMVAKGYGLAGTARMGPVHVEFPMNVLKGMCDLEPPARVKTRRRTTLGPLARVSRLVESSAKVVIFAGKSVARDRATEALTELAESLACPVVVHSYYPDAFPPSHRQYAGDANEWSVDPVAEMALAGADVLLLVGVQWGSAETAFLRKFLPKALVHIDVDRGYAAKRFPVPITLIGDLKAILSSLCQAGGKKPRSAGDRSSLMERILDVKERASKQTESILNARRNAKPIYPGLLARTLAEAADDRTILALDGSSTSSWFMDFYARKRKALIIWPGAYGSIGFALPAGIAAQVVHPDRRVIVGTGDGGFLMSYMDIATVLENKLPLTVVVTNNRSYGDIWHIQRASYKGRYIGTDLNLVDYAALARSFGGKGIRVEEPSQLEDACKEALESNTFTLLDVVTDGKCKFLAEELAIG